jgi:hypothetical protein
MGVDVPVPTSKAPLQRRQLHSTIQHLVLLDLLGAPHPQVRSYLPDTAWLFDALVSAETCLRDAGIIDAAALGASPKVTKLGIARWIWEVQANNAFPDIAK